VGGWWRDGKVWWTRIGAFGLAAAALILAGGLGERLRSVVSDRPKPMAAIAGRPFLEYVLLGLKKQDVTNVILCIGHGGSFIREYFAGGEKWGLRLYCSSETKPLGTGGALKLAEPLVSSRNFLVLNGDSFFGIDLRALIRFHESRKAQATIALAEVENTERYGVVEIAATGEVSRFLEKARRGPGLINGGIYVLSREVLASVPRGRAISLEREILPQLIGRGFYGLAFQSYFVDIGVPEEYLKLQVDFSRLVASLGLRRNDVDSGQSTFKD